MSVSSTIDSVDMPATAERHPWALAIQSAAERVNHRAAMDVVAPMTLLLLVFHGPKSWTAYAPIMMAASLALLFEGVQKSKALWLVLATFLLTSNYHHWLLDDNHKFLMSYWCLAVWTSLHAKSVDKALAVNGRLIVGLCFLFATLWKTITPDFLSGVFFTHELLIDERFKALTHYVANVEIDVLRENQKLWKELQSAVSGTSVVELRGVEQVRSVAVAMTAWTILIEGALALLFLAPRKWVGVLPDVALIAFVATTYLLAPVYGFAMILLAMGVAQCDRRHRYLRLSYLVTFCLLNIYALPWAQLLGLSIAKAPGGFGS